MPHWAWVTLVFGGIIALFGLLLRAGGEPLDREDTGGGDSGDFHSGHGDSGGHH